MRALIVDDNRNYLDALASEIRKLESRVTSAGRVSTISHEKDTPYDIALKISREIPPDGEVLVLINLELCCKDIRRQDFAGAEVLKFLRLADDFYFEEKKSLYKIEPNRARSLHCLVYSFLPLEEILRRKPNNLLLLSDGVTHLTLPNEFTSISFTALAALKPRINALQSYVRGDFSMPNERHAWANWWGIKQLRDVHAIVLGRTSRRYPARIYEELRKLPSLQAAYLFGHTRNDLTAAYQHLKGKISTSRLSVVSRSPRVLHIDDRWQDGWSKVFMDMIYDEQLKPYSSSISTESPFETYCLGEKPTFRILRSFDSNWRNIDPIYQNLKALLSSDSENGPDLILLDLRLFGEKGGNWDVENLSGSQLLKRLRQDFRSIPVIMTTASNKARSHERLLQLGADGYWIKEGVDENSSPDVTVRNYLRLLDLVDKATGGEYQFLKAFDREVGKLRATLDLWWENHEWLWGNGNREQTFGRRDIVFGILDETMLMLRAYLHGYVMGYAFQDRDTKTLGFWASTVFRHVSSILEEIHRFDSYKLANGRPCSNGIIGGHREMRRKLSMFVTCRADWFAYFLYRKRNDATHSLDRGVNIDWAQLRTFLKYLLCYLKDGPQLAFEAPSILAAADSKDDNPALTDSILASMLTLSSNYDSLFGALSTEGDVS